MLAAAGGGMWLTALAVQYRDVKYAISLLVMLLMYASPVVYPASLVPEQYRDLFEKRYRLGMNSREIAEALGIPAPTVRSRLHLGMKKLRSQMAKLR